MRDDPIEPGERLPLPPARTLDVVTQPGQGPRPRRRTARSRRGLRHAGRYKLVAQLARELIAGGARDPAPYDVVAFLHRRAGDFVAAAADLAEVAALDPEIQYRGDELRHLLARCSRREEALAQRNGVVASEQNWPPRWNTAWARRAGAGRARGREPLARQHAGFALASWSGELGQRIRSLRRASRGVARLRR